MPKERCLSTKKITRLDQDSASVEDQSFTYTPMDYLMFCTIMPHRGIAGEIPNCARTRTLNLSKFLYSKAIRIVAGPQSVIEAFHKPNGNSFDEIGEDLV